MFLVDYLISLVTVKKTSQLRNIEEKKLEIEKKKLEIEKKKLEIEEKKLEIEKKKLEIEKKKLEMKQKIFELSLSETRKKEKRERQDNKRKKQATKQDEVKRKKQAMMQEEGNLVHPCQTMSALRNAGSIPKNIIQPIGPPTAPVVGVSDKLDEMKPFPEHESASHLDSTGHGTALSGDSLKLVPRYPEGIRIMPNWGEPVAGTSDDLTRNVWDHTGSTKKESENGESIVLSSLYCQGSMECPDAQCPYYRRTPFPRSATKKQKELGTVVLTHKELLCSIRSLLDDIDAQFVVRVGHIAREHYFHNGTSPLQQGLLDAMKCGLVCERCLLRDNLVCFMIHVRCNVSYLMDIGTKFAWKKKRDVVHTHSKHRALGLNDSEIAVVK